MSTPLLECLDKIVLRLAKGGNSFAMSVLWFITACVCVLLAPTVALDLGESI